MIDDMAVYIANLGKYNEGYMKVEGETAYCIDINTDFKNGYKTRAGGNERNNWRRNNIILV